MGEPSVGPQTRRGRCQGRYEMRGPGPSAYTPIWTEEVVEAGYA